MKKTTNQNVYCVFDYRFLAHCYPNCNESLKMLLTTLMTLLILTSLTTFMTLITLINLMRAITWLLEDIFSVSCT